MLFSRFSNYLSNHKKIGAMKGFSRFDLRLLNTNKQTDNTNLYYRNTKGTVSVILSDSILQKWQCPIYGVFEALICSKMWKISSFI